MFVERQYRCLDHLKSVGLIIDAGANAGYASAYFLSNFPQSTVIAIEPDRANFTLLQKNVKPYGPRILPLRAALWWRDEVLDLDETANEPGENWARRVKPSKTSGVKTETIQNLIASNHASYPRISILKIDIEGAETEIFKADTSWLANVDNIVIDLEDAAASEAFHRAVAPHGFSISRCGELTVCLRRSQ
jgi:FkbM family methyltransferase